MHPELLVFVMTKVSVVVIALVDLYYTRKSLAKDRAARKALEVEAPTLDDEAASEHAA